jgi:hypothetical protein
MKKIVIFSCLILIFLFSCKEKENPNVKELNNLDFAKIDEVENELDQDAQKSKYLKLNSSEKHQIWKLRIEKFMKISSFNSEQLVLINKVKFIMDDKLFDGSEESKIKLSNLESQLNGTITDLGSKLELKEVFSSLKPIGKNYKSSLRVKAGGCQCNGNSMFDCDRCSGGCLQSSDGCGFFLLFSCNYQCNGIAPNEQ